MLNKRRAAIISIATCLALTSCNFPGMQSQATKTIEAQAMLQTSVAKAMLGLTQTASVGKPTATEKKVSNTPVPVTIPTIEPTRKPDQNNAGTDATTLAGETIPDDTNFLPGTTFSKTWRLMNSGTSTWSTEYKLVFAQGDQMGANNEYRFNVPVEPGKIIDITIQMKAPETAGTYKGFWKIKNPNGTVFGPGGNGSFWVKIISAPATATVTSPATSTATSAPPTATPTLTTAPS